jgi:hypothetical protein
MAPASSRLSLVQWIVLAIIPLAIAAVAVPGLIGSARASRERQAASTLKTFSSAEADFRANDKDWNHVNDFWTADVKGLYTMTSAGKPGAPGDALDPAIKLIELTAAAADADESFFPAGGENMPLRTFASPAARQGFWYAALTLDLCVTGMESTYRRDTGGSPAMGSCHNTSKFGFVAFPDSPWQGTYIFLVNENNTIFRTAMTGNARLGSAVPPGLHGFSDKYHFWPSDEELKQPRGLHGPD